MTKLQQREHYLIRVVMAVSPAEDFGEGQPMRDVLAGRSIRPYESRKRIKQCESYLRVRGLRSMSRFGVVSPSVKGSAESVWWEQWCRNQGIKINFRNSVQSLVRRRKLESTAHGRKLCAMAFQFIDAKSNRHSCRPDGHDVLQAMAIGIIEALISDDLTICVAINHNSELLYYSAIVAGICVTRQAQQAAGVTV